MGAPVLVHTRFHPRGANPPRPAGRPGVATAASDLLLALLSALLLAGSACSGGARSGGFVPLPDRLTRATVVGPLCDGEACKCLEPGDDPGQPDPGAKRYQFTLGPTANEMWVMVDDMVLYKGVERATDCFLVDLRHGEHRVVVRAAGASGFAAGLTVNELGAKGPYATFEFACGGPDPCAFDHIDEFKQGLARYPRGVHDPCGSTRIRAIEWLTGKSEDRVHPSELQLSLTLDAYDFTPEQPSGDPSCKDRF